MLALLQTKVRSDLVELYFLAWFGHNRLFLHDLLTLKNEWGRYCSEECQDNDWRKHFVNCDADQHFMCNACLEIPANGICGNCRLVGYESISRLFSASVHIIFLITSNLLVHIC